MILSILIESITIRFIIVAIISVLAHEFGHYIVAKIYGIHPRFGWDDQNLTVYHDRVADKWKCISINLAGLFAGILSIILLLRYIEDEFLFLLLMIGMIMASRFDIVNIIYRIKYKVIK